MERFKPTDNMAGKEHIPHGGIVIFTDLDGSLLDHESYSYAPANEALRLVRETQTPLIPISSKNPREIEALEKEMGIWRRDPFVAENGHGIFIPEGYFPIDIAPHLPNTNLTDRDGFTVVDFGVTFPESIRVLEEIKKETGLAMVLQSELNAEQFAQETGLSLPSAELALQRSYLEGFRYDLSPDEQKEARMIVREKLAERGYGMTQGGRYDWLLGPTSKAHAATLLTNLYRASFGEVTTIGVGDAPNDDFLTVCDRGYLVKNPRKVVEVDWENVTKVDGEGPHGWNDVILRELKAQA